MKVYTVKEQAKLTRDELPERLKDNYDGIVGALVKHGKARDIERITLALTLVPTISTMLELGRQTGVLNKKATREHFETVTVGLGLTRAIGNFLIDKDNQSAMPNLPPLQELQEYDAIEIKGNTYDIDLVIELINKSLQADSGLYDAFYANHKGSGTDKLLNCFKLADALLQGVDKIIAEKLPEAQKRYELAQAIKD